jgi:hypothetical protein
MCLTCSATARVRSSSSDTTARRRMIASSASRMRLRSAENTSTAAARHRVGGAAAHCNGFVRYSCTFSRSLRVPNTRLTLREVLEVGVGGTRGQRLPLRWHRPQLRRRPLAQEIGGVKDLEAGSAQGMYDVTLLILQTHWLSAAVRA